MYKKSAIAINNSMSLKTMKNHGKRPSYQHQVSQCCSQNYKGNSSYRELVKSRLLTMLEKNNIVTINTASYISSNKLYTFDMFNMPKNITIPKNITTPKSIQENQSKKNRYVTPRIDIIAEANGFITYKEYNYLVDRCETQSDDIFSIYRPDEYAKSIFYDIESCVQDYPNRYSIVISYDKHTHNITDLFIAYYPTN